jgi:hypothetical protein
MFAKCAKETNIVVSFKLYYTEVLLIIAYFEVVLNMCSSQDYYSNLNGLSLQLNLYSIYYGSKSAYCFVHFLKFQFEVPH